MAMPMAQKANKPAAAPDPSTPTWPAAAVLTVDPLVAETAWVVE